MHSVSSVIDTAMTEHTLPLQRPYTKASQFHDNFASDHSSEVILGYMWDKQFDTIIPHIILSHGRKSHGDKGPKLADQPLGPKNITKNVIVSLLQQLWDPVGIFLDIFRLGMKALNCRVCLVMPGTDNFNTPIAELSESLALAASKICNNLLHVSGNNIFIICH